MSSAGTKYTNLHGSKDTNRTMFVNSLNKGKQGFIYEKMAEGGGVKGQGRNMGFANNQTLKCTGVQSSNQDATH